MNVEGRKTELTWIYSDIRDLQEMKVNVFLNCLLLKLAFFCKLFVWCEIMNGHFFSFKYNVANIKVTCKPAGEQGLPCVCGQPLQYDQ